MATQASKGLFEETKAYFEQALALFEKLGSQLKMAEVCHNLGDLCLEKLRIEEALKFYRKALPIYEEFQHQPYLDLLRERVAYFGKHKRRFLARLKS